MKKETIYPIVVSVLVVVSAIGIPFGYFVGKAEREVVASECGDVVCPECPNVNITIPPIEITLPEYPDINITYPQTYPQINITITEPPDWGETCLEYPTNYLVFIDDSNRTGNVTEFAFYIWYYNNDNQMFENSPIFDNWTHVVDWVNDKPTETFSECQRLFLIVWLLGWAYLMETGEPIGG